MHANDRHEMMESIKERQEEVRNDDLVGFIIDWRNDLDERIAAIKFDHNTLDYSAVEEFIDRAKMTLYATHLRIRQEEQNERYEVCRYYHLFATEYRKLFRLAIRSYTNWTIDQYNALEACNERILREYLPR